MKLCNVEGCANKSRRGKMCSKHYSRITKYGDPHFVKSNYEQHGLTHHPLYLVWKAIKQRTDPRHAHRFPRYSGRGIIMCARWAKFTNFLADMGERPDGYTIERIDNDGNYEPSNCRWATPAEQNMNRTIPLLVMGGRAQSMTAWAKEAGMDVRRVSWRIKHGWPPEDAINPKQRSRPGKILSPIGPAMIQPLNLVKRSRLHRQR